MILHFRLTSCWSDVMIMICGRRIDVDVLPSHLHWRFSLCGFCVPHVVVVLLLMLLPLMLLLLMLMEIWRIKVLADVLTLLQFIYFSFCRAPSQIGFVEVDAVVLHFPPSSLQHLFWGDASDGLLQEVVSLMLLLAHATSFSLPSASVARTPHQLLLAPSSFSTHLLHRPPASGRASTNLPPSTRDLAPYFFHKDYFRRRRRMLRMRKRMRLRSKVIVSSFSLSFPFSYTRHLLLHTSLRWMMKLRIGWVVSWPMWSRDWLWLRHYCLKLMPRLHFLLLHCTTYSVDKLPTFHLCGCGVSKLIRSCLLLFFHLIKVYAHLPILLLFFRRLIALLTFDWKGDYHFWCICRHHHWIDCSILLLQLVLMNLLLPLKTRLLLLLLLFLRLLLLQLGFLLLSLLLLLQPGTWHLRWDLAFTLGLGVYDGTWRLRWDLAFFDWTWPLWWYLALPTGLGVLWQDLAITTFFHAEIKASIYSSH